MTYLCLANAEKSLREVGTSGIDAATRVFGFFGPAMAVGLTEWTTACARCIDGSQSPAQLEAATHPLGISSWGLTITWRNRLHQAALELRDRL